MVIRGPGFTNGVIILDEPEAVYYAGQLLSGNVHFELKEPITYSALNLVYLGEALVQRVEKQYEMSGGNDRYKYVKYEGREQYFNFVQCVLGAMGTTSTLPAGVHAIPFKFQVPFNAPSSFKGEDGRVLYSITAYLEYPQPKREQLVKEFQVVAPLCPDTLAKFAHPLELVFDEIETCSCFCASKPIKLRISLPSGALAAGSVVPIVVKVENDSSTDIRDITCWITKRETYRTHVPRSECSAPEEVVAEVRKGPVLGDTRRVYRWELPLPPAALPNLQPCSVIDLTYMFKARVRLAGCNDPVEDEAEVVVGVLPPSAAVTSPELAALLPKAPPPDPNTQQIEEANYPPNTHTPQQYAQIETKPVESAQSPYEIGFRNNVPTQPPYPVAGGYPYPAAPQAPYNVNTSPQVVVPSAPPM